MTSLFLNIHTGQWWCVGRDAKSPVKPFRWKPRRYDSGEHRIEIEVASCHGLEELIFEGLGFNIHIQEIRYYVQPFDILDSGWVLTSQRNGDRFGLVSEPGNIQSTAGNGRETVMCKLQPIDARRAVGVGETLMAYPEGFYADLPGPREERTTEWFDTDGNEVVQSGQLVRSGK